ncbi:MAG: hypothetical protein EXX96DRAFT_563976 [Benjaminiella poitrasii]|nr:MAG: hypothetical protein EXX96DRAFT_563976 [Benjaminiella poitrasii]
MSPEKQDEIDIIDIQDKMGYVDTGLLQNASTPQNRKQQPPQIVFSDNSHLNLKEPRPQKHVQIFVDNHRNATFDYRTKEAQQEIKGSSTHDSLEPLPSSSTLPSQSVKKDIPISQQQQQQSMPENRIKGKEKLNTDEYNYNKPASKARYRTSESESDDSSTELKDKVVTKLYEIADMLKSLNIIENQQRIKKRRSTSSLSPSEQRNDSITSSPSLKPSPSKSDSYPYQPPPLQRRSSDKKRRNYVNPSANSSPENYGYESRPQHYTNIAATNVNQPMKRNKPAPQPLYHTEIGNSSQYHSHPANGNYYVYYPLPYYDHHYRYPEEEQDYYSSSTLPPPPPPVRYNGSANSRLRRPKSYSNIMTDNDDAQYYYSKPVLQRKGSKGNLRRPTARRQPMPIYDDIIYDDYHQHSSDVHPRHRYPYTHHPPYSPPTNYYQ